MSDLFTPNLRLTRTEFNTRNWQDKVNNNFTTLDSVVGSFLPLSGLKGVWVNSLPILANDILVDIDLGTIWKAVSPHTTASTGTFLEDRLARPSLWIPYAAAAQARGAWTGPGTNYNVNDFVVVSGVTQRYAIALTTHTSGASFDADLALNRWAVLIDVSLSGLGLGTMSTQNKNAVDITGGDIGTAVKISTAPDFSTFLDMTYKIAVAAPPSDSLGRATLTKLFDLLMTDRFGSFTSDTTLTITAGSGTFTSVNGDMRFIQMGKLVFVHARITVVTNGTAGTFVNVAGFDFPDAQGTGQFNMCGCNDTTGNSVFGRSIATANNMVITLQNNTYPITGDGQILRLDGVYEAA